MRQRDRDNLNPTAEAVAAMNLWNDDYAFKQKGGSMDFWDSLSEAKKQRCRDLVRRIREADKAHGVDKIVWRRFGPKHEKPCRRPEIITCAMPECQYAGACQAVTNGDGQ